MSPRAKKQSHRRRIIVDLSWPIYGHSVNSGIDKDTFLDNLIKLIYPTIDLLCKRAYKLGCKCVGWQKDMERAFCQVPLCPLVYSKLGISWMGGIWFDKAEVMGCRSAPYLCQMTTNTIRHFMADLTYVIYIYIDDFMSLDYMDCAWKSYNTLGNLLRDLGVNEAIDKAVPPSHIIEFLGVTFDLLRMLLILPQDKMDQINILLKQWHRKTRMKRKELQSIAGKLQFASVCVRPGRVFITRLYTAIVQMQDGVIYDVSEQV